MRTVIDLPDDLMQSLDRVSGAEKRSRASLIREAISAYLRLKSMPPAEAAFGLWKAKATDGVQYQAELRQEWDQG
jgi:predicted transcriptional regulator